MADSSERKPAVFRSNRGRNLLLVSERVESQERKEPTQNPITQEVLSLRSQVAAYQAKESQYVEKEKEIQQIMATVRIALQVLGRKSLVFLSLIASIGAFGLTIIDPTALRITAAVLFTVIVFLPALWADAK